MVSKIDVERIRNIAEGYYRDGDFFCSEAIVKTIKDEFQLPISDDIIAAASGFPVGMGGSGCTCGAVVGGIMALGLFFGRTEAKDDKVNQAMGLANELHELFRKRHKSLCCRVLTKDMELGSPKHMDQCISFTGEVAEEVAKIIVRELDKKEKERLSCNRSFSLWCHSFNFIQSNPVVCPLLYPQHSNLLTHNSPLSA